MKHFSADRLQKQQHQRQSENLRGSEGPECEIRQEDAGSLLFVSAAIERQSVDQLLQSLNLNMPSLGL